MKANDFKFLLVILLAFLLFIPSPFMEGIQQAFIFNKDYWAITSFLKFGILSTLGECLGLRILQGKYFYKGFGIIPRAIVWGLLGIGIKIAFVIFSAGTPVFLEKLLGMESASAAMQQSDIISAADAGLGWSRLIVAFSISTAMNLIFAPVFMTLHRITDMHILQNGGKLSGFFSPIAFYKHFPAIDWKKQWDFVFKKTIPLFWIPAHTITFLLPEEFRVLFAAVLGVVLGILLALAAGSKK
jgi:hypothetical protein